MLEVQQQVRVGESIARARRSRVGGRSMGPVAAAAGVAVVVVAAFELLVVVAAVVAAVAAAAAVSVDSGR